MIKRTLLYSVMAGLAFMVSVPASVQGAAEVLGHQYLAAGNKASSDWSVNNYARTRLIASKTGIGPADSQILLGFEIDLNPGWKTYWRSPGEAGVPPRWHWTKTRNVLDAHVEWPLPARYSYFGIETMGYEKRVVFPIIVKLMHPGKAVNLSLDVDYFVCEQICVPLQGHYTLHLPAMKSPKASAGGMLIKTFLDRVPVQAAKSQAIPGGLKVTGVKLTGTKGSHTLLVDVAAAGSLDQASLFVEGPPELGFGIPGKDDARPDDSRAQFRIAVYGDGENVAHLLAKTPVVLTLSDGRGNAAEFHVKID